MLHSNASRRDLARGIAALGFGLTAGAGLAASGRPSPNPAAPRSTPP
jgi:hypothetical protein